MAAKRARATQAFRATLVIAVVLVGCLVDPAAGPATFPTVEDAIRASGLDPSRQLRFGDHVALVHREGADEVALTTWHKTARGWTFGSEVSTTRVGELSDAVIIGGPPETGWQVAYMFGYLPPGVASIDPMDIPGSVMSSLETGEYLLILGDIADIHISDAQSIGWHMRDRTGRVLREGHGDCCPELD